MKLCKNVDNRQNLKVRKLLESGFVIFCDKGRKLGGCSQSSKANVRSRLRIEVRPTENDPTRLYKNGDISVFISAASSNLLDRKSKRYFIIKLSLLISIVLCWREIRSDAGKTTENKFVANFLSIYYPDKRIQTKLLCC